jgi:hypothetical protein
MMSSESKLPAVDSGKLTRSMLIALIGAVAACSLLLLLINRPESWRGLLAACVAVRQEAQTAAMGILAAGGVRLIVAASACVVAVAVGGFPPADTLILLIPLYLAVLAAEAVVLYRALWKASA